jgi:hypothetical protein
MRPALPRNERRAEESLYAAILVDLGITYKRLLGLAQAQEFFRTQGVPLPIADRILTGGERRRLTVWEQAEPQFRTGETT